jgi:Protein of unknown function (DUF2469)
VVGKFRFVVETERGVYLANDVETTADDTGGGRRLVLELRDAWVWDMYRPQRFVPRVRIVTSRDVVVEEIGTADLDVTKAGLSDGIPSTDRADRPADPSASTRPDGSRPESDGGPGGPGGLGGFGGGAAGGAGGGAADGSVADGSPTDNADGDGS